MISTHIASIVRYAMLMKWPEPTIFHLAFAPLMPSLVGHISQEMEALCWVVGRMNHLWNTCSPRLPASIPQPDPQRSRPDIHCYAQSCSRLSGSWDLSATRKQQRVRKQSRGVQVGRSHEQFINYRNLMQAPWDGQLILLSFVFVVLQIRFQRLYWFSGQVKNSVALEWTDPEYQMLMMPSIKVSNLNHQCQGSM